MKKYLALLALAAFAATPALAADTATATKPADAAKPAAAAPAAAKPAASNAQQDKMKACNDQAGDKKGDERKAFMKTCLSAKAEPAKPESKMAMCNKKTAGLDKDARAKAQSECMKGS